MKVKSSQTPSETLAAAYLKELKETVLDAARSRFNQLQLNHPDFQKPVLAVFVDKQGELKMVVKDKNNQTQILTVKSVNGKVAEGKELLKRLYLLNNPTIEFEGIPVRGTITVDTSEIRALGIRVRKGKGGLEVLEVKKDSLGQRLGLKKGDVIMGATYTDSNRDLVRRIFNNEKELILFMVQAQTSIFGYKNFKLAVKPAGQPVDDFLINGRFNPKYLKDLDQHFKKTQIKRNSNRE